jgi:SHS2 domain-containing protein|tara:strand:- start:442 stop:840 length:399 start_codon:yes stop_codon:yes gene_type:complete
MTDALIEAYGTSLDEAFDNAARGLIDTMVDIKTIEGKIEENFEVNGSDLKSLLYNWLESVLVKVTLNGLVFSSFDVKIRKSLKGFEIKGVGVGETLDLKKHKPKTEAKAVTYHMMRIIDKKDQVSVRFLIDL